MIDNSETKNNDNDKNEISKTIGSNNENEITGPISDDQVIHKHNTDDNVDSTEREQEVVKKLEDEEWRKAAELMLAIIFNL